MIESCRNDETLDERYSALWAEAGPTVSAARFLLDHGDAPPSDQIEILLVDQLLRWRNGCPKRVEDYQAEYPGLAGTPEFLLKLIQGDFLARLGRRETPDPAAYVATFPHLADEIRTQCEVDQWLTLSGEVESGPSLATTVDYPHSAPGGPKPAGPVDADAPLRESDFRIVRELGAGGMGEVFEAVQKSLGKVVALKLIRREALDSRSRVRRFIAEARVLGRLNHPGIVGVHGIGRMDDGRYFLVMDLVAEGTTLASLIKSGPLPFECAAALVVGIAEAIEHAHGRGVVHRDLKPSNVLLDTSGNPHVTDFGLAKVFDQVDPDHPQTTADSVLGTPHYMSPEQADPSRGPITPRTDVYGLGGLLYSLLTAHPPVQGDSITQLLAQVVSAEPVRSPRDWRSDTPPALERICLACLSKDVDRRPGSAREVAQALRDWLASPAGSRTEAEPQRSPRHAWFPDRSLKGDRRSRHDDRWAPVRAAWPSRRRLLLAAASAVTLVLALLVAAPLVLLQRFEARSPGPSAARPKEPRSETPRPSPPEFVPPAPADPITSWELHVYRPPEDGKTWEDLGDALAAPLVVRVQDRIKLRASFHEPVFAAVLAINPDGTVQRLKGDKDDRPDRLFQSLAIPPDPDRYVKLTDPGPTGFVLLAARRPVQSLERTIAGTSIVDVAAWRASRPETTWTFDGRQVVPILRTRVAEESVGPKPFVAMCENLQPRDRITSARAVVFTVQPR